MKLKIIVKKWKGNRIEKGEGAAERRRTRARAVEECRSGKVFGRVRNEKQI
jgi:hypothetical protein